MIKNKPSSRFLKLSALAVLGFCGIQAAWAEDFVPVFSGQWYKYTYPMSYYYDSAGQLVWIYPNGGLGDPGTVLNPVLTQEFQTDVRVFLENGGSDASSSLQLSAQPHFVSGDPSTPPEIPQDFPGGYEPEFNQIVANGGPTVSSFSSSVTGQICDNHVKMKVDGPIVTVCGPPPCIVITPGGAHLCIYLNDVLGTTSLTPHYICPPGSRTFQGPCSTPLVANADVVGRDLDAPIIGSVTGHIGLTTYSDLTYSQGNGNYVLQVMNEPGNVVQQVSLGNFEHATSYWGEVYGLPGINPQSEADDAETTLETGWNQRSYNPTYTTGFAYQAGGLSTLSMINNQTNSPTQQLGVTQAIFRCDTFVDYAYSQGYKINLPLQPPPVIGPAPMMIPTPLTTYGSFLNKRTDVPPQPADPTLSSAPVLTASQKDALGITPELSQAQTTQLDQSIQPILKNNTLSTDAKNTAIWSLAQQNKNTPAQFTYLVDTLSLGQRACSLAPQYISDYGQESSIANKKDLLSAIANSCLKSGNLINSTQLSSTEINSILQAQTFIAQTLESETNPILIKQALSSASEILPSNSENYQVISQAITRLNQNNSSLSDSDSRSINLIQLAFVFANPNLQNAVLPSLLKNYAAGNSPSGFDPSLLLILKTLNPEAISSSVKSALLNYLNTQKLNNPNLTSFQTQEGVDFLVAEATLNNPDQASKNQSILKTILSSNTNDQALLIGQLDNSVFANMPLETLKELQKNLQENLRPNLKQAKSTPREKMMQGVAISKLYKIINQD